MEAYIYYGKLPLIEEGPVADYKGYGKETTVTISIRFRAATWRNEVKAMGFLLDAPFPAIGYYTPIPEVVVSNITPSSPDGPTILIQISGAGTFGGTYAYSDTDFANNLILTPFDNPYRRTLPLKYRQAYIISDKAEIAPYEENFTAKDVYSLEYTATGRKSTRMIIMRGLSTSSGSAGLVAIYDKLGAPAGSGLFANSQQLSGIYSKKDNETTFEPDGKTLVFDHFTGVDGIHITQSLEITEWTAVRNQVYTTP